MCSLCWGRGQVGGAEGGGGDAGPQAAHAQCGAAGLCGRPLLAAHMPGQAAALHWDACFALMYRDGRLVLQRISSKQSVFFVWELQWTQEPPPSLHCRFSVGFSPAAEERLSISLKPYTYEFQVENFFVRIVLFFWWGCGLGK